MPIPRSTPRLQEIVPTELARDLVQGVVDAIQGAAANLAPVCVLVAPDPAAVSGDYSAAVQASRLYGLVVDLCSWAQRGDGRQARVHETLMSVARAAFPWPLEHRPGGPIQWAGLDELLGKSGDPDTHVGLVLLAAKARMDVVGGRDVTPRELAALGSLSALQVRRLIQNGRIKAKGSSDAGWRISPLEARRWLGERGVPGFPSPARPRAGRRAALKT